MPRLGETPELKLPFRVLPPPNFSYSNSGTQKRPEWGASDGRKTNYRWCRECLDTLTATSRAHSAFASCEICIRKICLRSGCPRSPPAPPRTRQTQSDLLLADALKTGRIYNSSLVRRSEREAGKKVLVIQFRCVRVRACVRRERLSQHSLAKKRSNCGW